MADASIRESAPQGADISLVQVRQIAGDLFEHRPGIYWFDMLLAAAIGWGGLVLAALHPADWRIALPAVVVSGLAFLRAVLFIHEISHFRRGVMPGFALVWNLVVGVPMCLPSFMYCGTHTDHHKRNLYGTARDPEYLPLALLGRGRIVRFLLEMLLVPALLLVRFGLLTPLSWFIPPLRRVVIERMSALVINPAYVRRDPEGADRRNWIAMEAAILFWIVAWAVALWLGKAPITHLYVWYAVAVVTALVNQFRTLTAHHYTNAGDEMSVTGQLLDSINVRGVFPLTDLAFPVGLKFHALHHLLPDMPYHGLAECHQRLLAGLPKDSPYRAVEYPGLAERVAAIWRAAKVR